MKIYPFIRTQKQVGTAMLRFRMKDGNSFVRYYSSDIVVNVALFDNKKGTYRLPRLNAKTNLNDEYKQRLDEKKQLDEKITAVVETMTAVYLDRGHDLTGEELPKLIDERLHPEKYRCTFAGLFDEYTTANHVTDGYRKCFRACKEHLLRYADYMKMMDKTYILDANSFDAVAMGKFANFLLKEDKNFDADGNPLPQYKKLYERHPMRLKRLNNHTIFLTCNILKIVLRWAYNAGKTERYQIQGFRLKCTEYADPIFLTVEERNTVVRHDYSSDMKEARYRDAFIFQCLTGERVSDLMSFCVKNVVDGWLTYIPIKTREKNKRTCRVPLNDEAKAIVEKYSQGKSEDDSLFGIRNDVTYNNHIKRILTDCGITRKVTVTDEYGNSDERPLNEIATSHIARKTFIGNLYKKVHDPNLISKMSGHCENSKAFARYRKIEDSDLIEVISLL